MSEIKFYETLKKHFDGKPELETFAKENIPVVVEKIAKGEMGLDELNRWCIDSVTADFAGTLEVTILRNLKALYPEKYEALYAEKETDFTKALREYFKK